MLKENAQEVEDTMLMIAGHNGHVAKKRTFVTFMGEELFEKYGDDYYVIDTDFYKTEYLERGNWKNVWGNYNFCK